MNFKADAWMAAMFAAKGRKKYSSFSFFSVSSNFSSRRHFSPLLLLLLFAKLVCLPLARPFVLYSGKSVKQQLLFSSAWSSARNFISQFRQLSTAAAANHTDARSCKLNLRPKRWVLPEWAELLVNFPNQQQRRRPFKWRFYSTGHRERTVRFGGGRSRGGEVGEKEFALVIDLQLLWTRGVQLFYCKKWSWSPPWWDL